MQKLCMKLHIKVVTMLQCNNVTYFIYTILILAVLKIQTLIFTLQPLFMAGIWFVI